MSTAGSPGSAERRRFLRGLAVAGAAHAAILAGGFVLLARLRSPAEAWPWVLKVGAALAFQLLLPLMRRRTVLSGENLDKLWGPANVLTMIRGALVALLAGFLFVPMPAGPAAWLPALLFTLSVTLDFVDGWLARRTASQTRLGALLDVEFDALAILLALGLAVHYGHLPLPFLAVGLARYLFVAGIAVRRRRGLAVMELPPSYLRRRLAGFQMGVLAVLLWPIAAPPATILAQALIAVPLLAGFGRDWLLVSGRLDPHAPGYRKLLEVSAGYAYRWAPLALRALLAASAVLSLVGYLNGGAAALGLPRLDPGVLAAVLAGVRFVLLGALVAGWKASPAALLLLLLEGARVFLAGADVTGLVVIACALLLYVLGPGPCSLGYPFAAAGRRSVSPPDGGRGGLRRLRHLLWLAVPFMLYWALRDVRFGEILSVLRRLRGLPLPALLGINLVFVLVLTLRWGLILRRLGVRIPLASLGAYRLAGFAVSYLTPGPQFGGEPVQLLLARRGSGLEYGTGSASILLDKSFELLANLAFLGFGAWAIAARGLGGQTGSASGVPSWMLFLVPGVLILLPVLYLTLSFAGRRPLSWLVAHLPGRRGERFSRLRGLLTAAEVQVAAFGRPRARAAGFAVLFFVLVWGLTLLETWLVLRFLGVAAGWIEVVILLAGSRFAFLLPFPGALGALEITQVSLFALLGLPAEAAWALLFYIRARDLLFAGTGLLALGVGMSRSPRVGGTAARAAASGGVLVRAAGQAAGGGSVGGGQVKIAPVGTGPAGTGAEVLDKPGQEALHPRVR